MKNAASNACLTIAILAAASFSGVAAANERAAVGDEVRVQFTDGETVVAEIDQRTNSHRLVLRFAGDTSVLLRSIGWQRVVTVVPVRPATGKTASKPVMHSVGDTRQLSYAELAAQALVE